MEETTNRPKLPLLALAAGPLLIAIGHALSVPLTGTANQFVAHFTDGRAQHIAGMLTSAIGVLLLVPGLTGLLRLLDGRSTLARVGAALGGIGAAGLGVGAAMVGVTMGVTTAASAELAARFYHAMDASSLGALPFELAPLFVIGFVLLGIALIRLGGALRRPGALLIVGAIVVVPAGSGGAISALLHLPLAIALVATVATVWRGGGVRGRAASQLDRPAPAGTF